MTEVRILVTGSRDWDDEEAVWDAIDEAVQSSEATHNGEVTIVTGACPTGADEIAKHAALVAGCELEEHPANWSTHGKRAGFVRNVEMVEAGADVCLAFLKPCRKAGCSHLRAGLVTEHHDSHGAAMTAGLCESKGIPVVYIRPPAQQEGATR